MICCSARRQKRLNSQNELNFISPSKDLTVRCETAEAAYRKQEGIEDEPEESEEPAENPEAEPEEVAQ
jgi:hypothetical protein